MGGYGRGSRRRVGARSQRDKILFAKDASSQQKQLLRVSRDIRTIKATTKSLTNYCQYQLPVKYHDIDHPGMLYAIPLMQPDKWNACFQTVTKTGLANKFQGRSVGIQSYFTCTNTNLACPPMVVDMYIVSLRAATAEQFQKETKALFEPNARTNDEYHSAYIPHDTTGNPGGKYFNSVVVDIQGTENTSALTFLNKGVFKILKHRSFMVGNQSNWVAVPAGATNYSSSQLEDQNKRFYDKIDISGTTIKSGHGKFTDLDFSTVQATDQLYVFIHHSHVQQDGITNKLNMTMNTIITGTTSN